MGSGNLFEPRRLDDGTKTVAPVDPGGPPESTQPRSILAGPALLIIAALALLLSAALLVPNAVLANYLGYACASLIAFSAVAVNRRAIVRVAGSTSTAASRGSTVTSAVLILAGFALSIVHAWFIARHYG